MWSRLTNQIEKNSKLIIIIVVIITILFTITLPTVKFETNLENFLPDTEVVESNERVKEYFGESPEIHYIYIEKKEKEETVLSLDSLIEQYHIVNEVKKIKGVNGTISAVDFLNTLLAENNKNIMNTTWLEVKELISPDDEENNSNTFTKDQKMYEDFVFLNFVLISEDRNWLPLYNKTPSTPIATSTLLLVQIDGSLSSNERKEISAEIRRTVENIDLQLVDTQHTSASLMAYDVDHVSGETNAILGAGAVIAIIIILIVAFRRFSYVFVPLFTLVIAGIWTLGTVILMGMTLTSIDVAVLPLILGIGIDYSIHFARRYQEELRKGKSVIHSTGSSMKHIGTAIFLTSITTAIAFSSNLTSGVSVVRDFGLICAIGVLYAFILTITFHSAIRYLLDKNRRNPIIGDKKKTPYIDLAMSHASTTVNKRAGYVILVVVGITIVSLIGAFNIDTEFGVEALLPENWSTMQAAENIRNNFKGGSYSQTYILIEGEVATRDTLFAIDKVQNEMSDDQFVVGTDDDMPRIESILETIDSAMINNEILNVNQTDDDIENKFDYILNKLKKDEPINLSRTFNFEHVNSERTHWMPNSDCTDEDIKNLFYYLLNNNTISDKFTNQTFAEETKWVLNQTNNKYSATLIRVYVNATTTTEARKMHNDFKTDIQAGDFGDSKTSITGGTVLTITTVDSIQKSLIDSTIISVILVTLILIVIYRNVWLGLITMLPVILGIFWILGTMYLLGISLNILTVMVTALTIGLGIDYAIHIVQRFKEDVEKMGVEESISSTLEHTGSSLFISGLTTICGFSILVLAPITMTRHFGIITAITIAYSLIVAVLVLPIALTIWAKRRKDRVPVIKVGRQN